MSLLELSPIRDGTINGQTIILLDCGQGRYKILTPECGGLEIFMCKDHEDLDVFVRAWINYRHWQMWHKEE